MAFEREIGRIGVLYSGMIWPDTGYRTESKRNDMSERVKESIELKKRDINDIPSVHDYTESA